MGTGKDELWFSFAGECSAGDLETNLIAHSYNTSMVPSSTSDRGVVSLSCLADLYFSETAPIRTSAFECDSGTWLYNSGSVTSAPFCGKSYSLNPGLY